MDARFLFLVLHCILSCKSGGAVLFLFLRLLRMLVFDWQCFCRSSCEVNGALHVQGMQESVISDCVMDEFCFSLLRLPRKLGLKCWTRRLEVPKIFEVEKHLDYTDVEAAVRMYALECRRVGLKRVKCVSHSKRKLYKKMQAKRQRVGHDVADRILLFHRLCCFDLFSAHTVSWATHTVSCLKMFKRSNRKTTHQPRLQRMTCHKRF